METTETLRWRNRWIFWCFLIVCSYAGAAERKSQEVEITNLTVPHSIENGTLEFVIFDCEFTLKDNLTDLLVLTWYYNDHHIVYSWIPEHKSRIVLGKFTGRIDMNFSVSDVSWQKYRAVKVLNPTTELSGKYSCDISTQAGHDRETSMLIVYSKPKEHVLELSLSISQDQINVSCWAIGSFPEPLLSISYEVNKTRVKLTEVVINSTCSEVSRTCDVRIYSLVNRNTLPTPTLFSCDVKIPNTSYLVRKDLVFSDRRMSVDESEEDDSNASKVGIGTYLPWFLLSQLIIHSQFN